MKQEKIPDLFGAVALVIGTGESAIAMAQSLIAEGARTMLVGAESVPLDEALRQLALSGCQAEGHVADCADKEQVTALMGRMEQMYGKIDVLVNAWEQFEQ